jgi:hypothetical protein
MSSPRLRSALNRAFLPVVLALLVVAGCGAWVAYGVHADPGTYTEQRVVSDWERQAYFDYRGVVGVENSVYPVGTELAGREHYLRSVVTDLAGELVFGIRGGEGSLTVATETDLVYRAVDADGETEYWRATEPLARGSYAVDPGSDAVVPFEIAIPDLVDRLEAIGEEMGQLPARTDAEARVVVRTHATGTVDGDPVNERGEFVLGLSVERGVLTVADPRLDTERYRSTASATLPVEYGPVETTVAPAAAGLSVLGVLVLVGLRWRGAFEVTGAERERLAFEAARRRHDDWITAGTVSGAALRAPRVRVASLTGLVDLAIDTESRVVEDEDRGRFFVREDGLVFVYDPPAEPAGDDEADGTVDEADSDDAASDDGTAPTGIATGAGARSADAAE